MDKEQKESNVLIFSAKHKLACQKNYNEFIDFSKNKLTLFNDFEFNKKKGWEAIKWSWTPKLKKQTIVFGISEGNSKYTPYKEPFSDFARAFVRYEMSLRPKKSINFARALDYIYKALEEKAIQNGFFDQVDLMHIDNLVINRANELILNSKNGDGTKRLNCISLAKLVKFIRDMKFKLNLQQYKSPIRRLKDTKIKLDEQSREEEKNKCPSDYQIYQVAEAFHRAETRRQKCFASLCVMLLCQPSRENELSELTINSLQTSDKGRLYLLWFPSKGGDPVRKWVHRLLEDVVKQAFAILSEISRPARAAAKFAYENPGLFWIHDGCITSKDFPLDRPLTYDQFANAMGFKYGNRADGAKIGWTSIRKRSWTDKVINQLNSTVDWRKQLLSNKKSILPNNQIAILGSNSKGNDWTLCDESIIFPSYKDLRNHVDKSYIDDKFPYLFESKVHVWDSITIIRNNKSYMKKKVTTSHAEDIKRA